MKDDYKFWNKHPHLADLQAYMDRIGLESKTLPTTYMSKDEWLSMYGYKILDSPDIINLYITQRALGMTPIVFRHLPSQFYADYASQFGIDVESVIEGGDITELFDEIICGSSDRATPGTFRWDVVRRSLEESGFHEFSGDSDAFDLYNFYREGHKEYVYKVFNGVHLPANGSELQRNLGVFLK